MTEIELIKKALAESTPAPWRINPYNDDEMIFRQKVICINYSSHQDFHLIANAPTWLASLITTIESQKEEIAELRDREYNEYPRIILDLETRIFKLQDDVEGYKAITELAVKENEFLKAKYSISAKAFAEVEFLISISDCSPNLYEESTAIFKKCIADIKRLSNEQT